MGYGLWYNSRPGVWYFGMPLDGYTWRKTTDPHKIPGGQVIELVDLVKTPENNALHGRLPADFVPTTDQVESAFAYDPEYEYHHPDDPGYHYANRAAFKRWLADHDREVSEKAWAACQAAMNELANPFEKE